MNEIETSSAPTQSRPSRSVSAIAAGLATVGLFTMARRARAVSPALTYSQIPGSGDIKVLNYALALEALEADLYAQALMRLTTGGTNALGKTITGLGLASTELDVKYIAEFGQVEADHRNFLISALGTQAITATTLSGAKFDFGFDTAGSNNSRMQVLDTVLEAEATGVQAYLGAIPNLQVKSPYLQIAAAIQGTEARHTTVVTLIRNVFSVQHTVTDPISPVAPLVNDTPNGASYNNSDPNIGTKEGRDQTLDPDSVLARVSPFIVIPST